MNSDFTDPVLNKSVFILKIREPSPDADALRTGFAANRSRMNTDFTDPVLNKFVFILKIREPFVGPDARFH
jgi:hypothetical protein